MPTWSHPLRSITEIGRPYVLDAEPADSPSAFVVRVSSPMAGAIALPGGDFLIAFATACPHMGCPLVKEDDSALVHRPAGDGESEALVCGPCPCHGTTFDLSAEGLVVLGPATQNLPQLELSLTDDVVRSDGWRREPDPRGDLWPISGGA